MEFGPFRFDLTSGKLSKSGIPIRLNGMPLKILGHLLERPGELASRKDLQRLLWNGTPYGDFEQGLNSAVNLLRRALNDGADQPRYIETVPGQGYRFVAPVRSVMAEAQGSNLAAGSPSLVPGQPGTESKPLARPASPQVGLWFGLTVIVALLMAAIWSQIRPTPKPLLDGSTRPSTNREVNDQFNLAFHFLAVQNDAPLARKTSERVIALDPSFAPGHLQHALFSVIEFFAGYTNDSTLLFKAEEEVHQAESRVPDSDGLLWAAKSAVYLAEGRLDRIPVTKLEDFARNGGDPTWLAILRMLAGQTEQPMELLRKWLERRPLDNPARMFMGELLRTRGDTANAIRVLQRNLQQGPHHMTPAFYLTLAYLDAGQPEQARGLLLRMRPEFETNYLWRHAWALLLAAEGKHNQASEFMDEENLKFARFVFSVWSTTAEFYALQGDKTKAFEWLQFAVSKGDERAFYFRRDPRLASMRDDTRFRLLVRDLDLRHRAFLQTTR